MAQYGYMLLCHAAAICLRCPYDAPPPYRSGLEFPALKHSDFQKCLIEVPQNPNRPLRSPFALSRKLEDKIEPHAASGGMPVETSEEGGGGRGAVAALIYSSF